MIGYSSKLFKWHTNIALKSVIILIKRSSNQFNWHLFVVEMMPSEQHSTEVLQILENQREHGIKSGKTWYKTR